MVNHLFPDFLKDDQVYAQAEQFWVDLWNRIDPNIRNENGWENPWLLPLPCSTGEGNQIFTAVSSKIKRGIRVFQCEPMWDEVDFYSYLSIFGGGIKGLVISCALSDAASELALKKMQRWVSNEDISYNPLENFVD